MSAVLEAQKSETTETIIRSEAIKRVLICNADGEPIGCVFVPRGGALVVEQPS